jgi:hypothetical protein
MSFQADDKARSRKLTNATQQVIGRETSHVLDEITYEAADKIHHVTFQFRGYFPGLTSSDLPSHFTVRVNDGLVEPCTHTLRDYYVLGFGVASCSDPITKIEFAVSAKADKHFTMPGGSVIHYGATPNESTPTVAAIPTPPAVAPSAPDRFIGLPDNLDAAIIHPEYPDVLMGFKGDAIHYQSIASEAEHTTTGSIADTFPEVTGTLQYAFRSSLKGVNGDGHNIYWQVWIYNTNMDYFRYEYAGGAIDNYTFLGTGNHSWKDYTASGEGWQLNFKDDNGVQKVDAEGNSGNFQPYGPGTSLYSTLPNAAPVSAVVNDLVNNRVIAMIDSTMYSLTGSPSNSVTETWTYG